MARGSAVVAFREEGRWQVGELPARLVGDLDGLIAALRQQPAEGGTLALVDVEHEFFVALRVTGGAVRVLLSDVTAALDWALAAAALQRLDVPVPDEEEVDDILPAGDLSIFADLGLDEMGLGAVLADTDAYADEQLHEIARLLGFPEDYRRVAGAPVH